MSDHNDASDASKPVIKDKNPHNYRKVGYSMIVISVSLVLIGLLVMSIGENYHFASDLMANQEIDSMTPKHGFNIVYYDTAQPVGAKLKLFDSASTMEDAHQKQIQYAQQNPGDTGKVIIFNASLSTNQQLVHDTNYTISQIQAAKAEAAKVAQAAQTSNASQNSANGTKNTVNTNSVQNGTSKETSNATSTTSQNQTMNNSSMKMIPNAVVGNTNNTNSSQSGMNTTQMHADKKITLSEKIKINASS